MVYVLISGFFALTLLAQSVLHHRERRDLYNRLMSRDMGEYRLMATKTHPKTPEQQNFMKKKIDNAYRSLRGGDVDDEE